MIELEISPGWQRRLCHSLGLIIGGCFGWYWFGNAGVGLAVLYCAAHWPKPEPRLVCVYLPSLRSVWLYPGAIVVQQYGEPVLWLFRDELSLSDYRGLRRRLKAQLQALL